MSAIGDVSVVSPQIQNAATGKAYKAQKEEGQTAPKLAESADQAPQASESGGPKATGNNVDITI